MTPVKVSQSFKSDLCVLFYVLFQLVDGALILYWLLWAPHDSDSSLYITGVATALVCLGENFFKLKFLMFVFISQTEQGKLLLRG